MVRGQFFRLTRPLSIVLLPVGTGQEPVFHIGKMWLEQLIKPARALRVVCLPKPSAGGAKAVLRKGWFFSNIGNCCIVSILLWTKALRKRIQNRITQILPHTHPVGPLLLNTYKLKPYILLVGIWQLSNKFMFYDIACKCLRLSA